MDVQLSKKSVRFMDSEQYSKIYGPIKIMQEGYVSDNEDPTIKHWHRECKNITGGAINNFNGKLLGNHKLTKMDKLKKVNNILTGTVNIENYKNAEDLLRSLYEKFGVEIVDKALYEVSDKKEGSIVIIRKDLNPGKHSKKSRYKFIREAFHYAENASIGKGNLSFSELMDGEKMCIVSPEFAQKILGEFGNYIELNTELITNEILLRESSINWKPTKKDENRLRFLLRWNEWLKFEKVVKNNTLDKYPSEWDALVGKIWNMYCGSNKRFGEIDRELVILNCDTGKHICVNGVPLKFGVDNSLNLAKTNSNKMILESVQNGVLPV